MRLAILDLQSVPKEPDGQLPFRWAVHHVKETFLAMLPRGFVLDGSSKVHIACGERGEEPKYQSVLGSSIYFHEAFDCRRFYLDSGEERDSQALEVIEQSLCDIAERCGNLDAEAVIRTTALAVRACDFSYTVSVKKLSKSSADRTVKAEVVRTLNRSDGEGWYVQLFDRDGDRLRTHWITNRPDYLDRTDQFSKSLRRGDNFILLDSFGKVVVDLPFRDQERLDG